MDKNDAESPTPGASIIELQEQVLILGVALGCSLKATAINDPTKAKAIEENMREVLGSLKSNNWQPLSRGLLDVLYSALQERRLSE